ncbi:MAG: hypothetical protein ACYS47_18735 [Planctomycetota bacterium]
MALHELDLLVEHKALPDRIRRLIEEAQSRIARFSRRRRENPVPGFVPCDFVAVHGALRMIAEKKLAPGPLFCEWGAGFGVAAALASELGYEASGIEIDEELADEARSLVRDFGLAVNIASGSFVPPEGEGLTDVISESEWLVMGGRNGYEALDTDPEDFGLVFAFPWPGEEKVILSLFDRFSGTGALLLLYLGVEGMRLYRKVGRDESVSG